MRWLVHLLRTRFGQSCLAPMLRFRVKHWRIAHYAWEGRPPLRIGVISDLHFGFWPMTEQKLKRIKQRLQATKPDVIVFLGDLSGGRGRCRKARNVLLGARGLAGLSAPLGVFSILGNHDWHDDAVAQARKSAPVAARGYLETAGFSVLQNEALRLRPDVWLAGLDSQQAIKGKRRSEPRREGRDDLKGTLAQAEGDDPVILLAHEPDVFPDIETERFVLVLSGHLHAGQIRLGGRAIYAPSKYGTRFAYGHFQNGTRHLIASAGLGASSIPLRIGTMPEITVVEISATAGEAASE